ncbi:MAG: phage holin family protein, partial [Clostridia bacterium]|nr:phage holin family protein [Clostridia bacterium]
MISSPFSFAYETAEKAGLAAAATYPFGGAHTWLLGLLVIVLLDYISVVIAAVITQEVNSRRGFAGILKKTLLFCTAAAAHTIDDAT